MLTVGDKFPEFNLTANVSREKGKEFKDVSSKDFAGKQAARQISVTFRPGGTNTRFEYAPKIQRYLNTNTHAARDDPAAPPADALHAVRAGRSAGRWPAAITGFILS